MNKYFLIVRVQTKRSPDTRTLLFKVGTSNTYIPGSPAIVNVNSVSVDKNYYNALFMI